MTNQSLFDLVDISAYICAATTADIAILNFIRATLYGYQGAWYFSFTGMVALITNLIRRLFVPFSHIPPPLVNLDAWDTQSLSKASELITLPVGVFLKL